MTKEFVPVRLSASTVFLSPGVQIVDINTIADGISNKTPTPSVHPVGVRAPVVSLAPTKAGSAKPAIAPPRAANMASVPSEQVRKRSRKPSEPSVRSVTTVDMAEVRKLLEEPAKLLSTLPPAVQQRMFVGGSSYPPPPPSLDNLLKYGLHTSNGQNAATRKSIRVPAK